MIVAFRSAKAARLTKSDSTERKPAIMLALKYRFSRKQRCFRGAKGDNGGAKGDNGISLTIDEHQNRIRGGQKLAKKISDFDIFRGMRT
jgi:hypothetical protein